MAIAPEQLAELLVERGLVQATEADNALKRQVLLGGSLDTQLLESSSVSEAALLEALADIHQLAAANKADIDGIDPEIPKTFP